VLRLGATLVPEITTTNLHYIYPPETVHVTVSNLDATNVDVEEAIERLAARRLSAPTFTVGGLGCSPDTLFLRCIHDGRFDRLRLAVEKAFELPPSGSPMSWLFRRLSFANVVRFDGPGEWQQLRHSRAEARCTTLEIVRTDRYLSLQGTTVIRTIPLQNTGRTYHRSLPAAAHRRHMKRASGSASEVIAERTHHVRSQAATYFTRRLTTACS
jgi:hypothetical protein